MTTFLFVLGLYALYFAAAIILILASFTAWHWLTNRHAKTPARRVEVDFDRVVPITAARSYDRTRGVA